MKIFNTRNQHPIVFLVLFLCSCSPFSEIAKSSVIQKEDSYLAVVNSHAGIKALTFGDFQFATTRKEYKKLHRSKSPFKNILVYAKTYEPTYEYYILYNPKNVPNNSNNFLVKDTLIDQSRYLMLISKTAPQKDGLFLRNSISRD